MSTTWAPATGNCLPSESEKKTLPRTVEFAEVICLAAPALTKKKMKTNAKEDFLVARNLNGFGEARMTRTHETLCTPTAIVRWRCSDVIYTPTVHVAWAIPMRTRIGVRPMCFAISHLLDSRSTQPQAG